jgi:hypothetical protein
MSPHLGCSHGSVWITVCKLNYLVVIVTSVVLIQWLSHPKILTTGLIKLMASLFCRGKNQQPSHRLTLRGTSKLAEIINSIKLSKICMPKNIKIPHYVSAIFQCCHLGVGIVSGLIVPNFSTSKHVFSFFSKMHMYRFQIRWIKLLI